MPFYFCCWFGLVACPAQVGKQIITMKCYDNVTIIHNHSQLSFPVGSKTFVITVMWCYLVAKLNRTLSGMDTLSFHQLSKAAVAAWVYNYCGTEGSLLLLIDIQLA